MGLETGTYLLDLVASNPTSTDGVTQGDDHLRLVKTTLRNTFPRGDRPFNFPDAASGTSNIAPVVEDANTTYMLTTTGGSVTVTLPVLAAGDSGWAIRLMKMVAANTITIEPPSGTINGAASVVLTPQYKMVEILWTGTEYVAFEPVIDASEIVTAMLANDAVTLDKLAHNTQGDILYFAASGVPTLLAAGTAGLALITKGAAANPAWDLYKAPLLHLQQRQSSGVSGGSATAGWNVRTITTEVTDEIGSTLSGGNTFTLPTGTYEIDASVPGYRVSEHQASLYNLTDTSIPIVGTSERSVPSSPVGITTRSLIKGRFTIASQKSFQIWHFIGTSFPDEGLGFPTNSGQGERYTDILIRKVA